MKNVLTAADLEITASAAQKMNELFSQVENDIAAIRVYAQPGGSSGVSFGMTFADKVNDDDLCRDHEGFKLIIDSAAIEYLRGAEVDFLDHGDGCLAFVFNNIPGQGGGGSGSSGSKSGSCG